MAQKAVVDTVMAYFKANFTAAPVRDINGDQTIDDALSGFVVVQFPAASVERFAVNERTYVEEGGIRFVINTERGAGSDQALTWADVIAGLFRDQRFGSVETKVPSSPYVDDSNDEGAFFVVTVVVPYRYVFAA